jgi:hypothetical protein
MTAKQKPHGRLKSWQQRDRLSREYQLPSCGWLYGDKLPDGKVTMSALRGEDEEIIGGAGGGTEALSVLRDVIGRLVDTKGLPYEELLFNDWIALLFNFFAFSYGSQLALETPCPNCKRLPQGSGAKDLVDLPCTIYAEVFDQDTFIEPFETEPLPPYDDVIRFRLLRLQDQLEAEEYFRKGRAAGKSGDFVRSFATAKHIVGINGEEVNFFEAMDYVRVGTTGATVRALREEFSAVEPGYDMSIETRCESCGFIWNIRLPEDGSFFRGMGTQSRKNKRAKIRNDQPGAGESELQ